MGRGGTAGRGIDFQSHHHAAFSSLIYSATPQEFAKHAREWRLAQLSRGEGEGGRTAAVRSEWVGGGGSDGGVKGERERERESDFFIYVIEAFIVNKVSQKLILQSLLLPLPPRLVARRFHLLASLRPAKATSLSGAASLLNLRPPATSQSPTLPSITCFAI